MDVKPQRFMLHESIEEALKKPDVVIPKLLPWIGERRWSGLKGARTLRVRVLDSVVLEKGIDYTVLVAFIRVSGFRGDSRISEVFFLPLFLSTSLERCDKGIRVDCQNGQIWVVEAEYTKEYNRRLFEGFDKGEEIETFAGRAIRFECRSTLREPDGLDVEILGKGDTTNIVVKIEGSMPIVVKTYKIVTDVNPEPEILEVLADVEFKYAPKLLGRMIYQEKKPTIIGVLEAYEDSVGDGRKPFLDSLVSDLLELRSVESGGKDLSELIDQKLGSSRVHVLSAHLGVIIAEFHHALANSSSRGFRPKEVLSEDVERWSRRASSNFEECLEGLSAVLESRTLPLTAERILTRLFKEINARRRKVEERISLFDRMLGIAKTRTHQDLHLAQLLSKRTDDSFDFMIIDFEGDPQRAGKARLELEPPLRDLGTMVRSFGYVKYAALAEVLREFSYSDAVALAAYLNVKGEFADDFHFGKPFDERALNCLIEYSKAWEKDVANAMLDGYFRRSRELDASYILKDGKFDEGFLRLIVEIWKMDKAVLEIRYELGHRPQNIIIPLEGLLSCIS